LLCLSGGDPAAWQHPVHQVRGQARQLAQGRGREAPALHPARVHRQARAQHQVRVLRVQQLLLAVPLALHMAAGWAAACQRGSEQVAARRQSWLCLHPAQQLPGLAASLAPPAAAAAASPVAVAAAGQAPGVWVPCAP